MYMEMAQVVSTQSYDTDTQVGALLVRNGNVLSMGWNGMPAGCDNNCKNHTGATNWEVLHAEANAILKCAKEGRATEGSTLYCTLSPCRECAKLILQAGISKVVFATTYKDEAGLIFLKNNQVEIQSCKLNTTTKSQS